MDSSSALGSEVVNKWISSLDSLLTMALFIKGNAYCARCFSPQTAVAI